MLRPMHLWRGLRNEVAVLCFRVYALDRKNQVLVSDDLIAPDRKTAVSRALSSLHDIDGWAAFELWRDARRVYKARREVEAS
jgi:hypothetical protein